MSETSEQDKGYPNTQKEGNNYLYTQACGGLGGGGCPTVLGNTHYIYSIKIPKFVVFNRRILFLNPQTIAIDPHTDAGADPPLCNNSLGSRVPWKLSFSVDGVLTDEEMKAGTEFNQAPPFEIEVNHLSLPQPDNPNWENKIYVHIWHGDPLHVNQWGEAELDIVKHDYDIKI